MSVRVRFSPITTVILIFAVTVLCLGGWYVWVKDKGDTPEGSNPKTQQPTRGVEPAASTAAWKLATTPEAEFDIRVPDGWQLVTYADGFMAATETAYEPGIPAVIENSDTEFMERSPRFRANITTLDDAGLGPQWASPQPGLEESTQDFSIGELHGKRFKGVFTQGLNQTLYEYVFDLGDGKKLDILYTVDHNKKDKDEVAIVEQAIKTIRF